MATTSNKRREVAQRLQEADAERSVPHPIEWYEEHGTADLFATLERQVAEAVGIPCVELGELGGGE